MGKRRDQQGHYCEDQAQDGDSQRLGGAGPAWEDKIWGLTVMLENPVRHAYCPTGNQVCRFGVQERAQAVGWYLELSKWHEQGSAELEARSCHLVVAKSGVNCEGEGLSGTPTGRHPSTQVWV